MAPSYNLKMIFTSYDTKVNGGEHVYELFAWKRVQKLGMLSWL